MAGEGSKEEVGSVLMQAMMAAKNLRPQCDRLLQRLRAATPAPADANDAKLRELSMDLFKVYYISMEAGARMLSTCLELKNGGRFAMNPSFAVMPDEQLHDMLLAQRFLVRVEAALFAVKLPQEYHIPRCIEHLVSSPPPPRPRTPAPEPGLLLVKSEHADMVAPDDESALKWAKEDYIREQVRRQRQAYEELQARRLGHEEGGAIILDSDEEEEAGPSSSRPRMATLGRAAAGTVAPAEHATTTTTTDMSDR
ncbi:uncharacterized protein LOC119279933 [Triticum dicoccoides]|uniref:uncharacterized protein LOC119279933 n=1 Tax=Triticum dicoccoides TaxID=85692 RepID=UPI00188E685D|nr:uncharacterized protein LOC119279933 [Triticum dicoccoides]